MYTVMSYEYTVMYTVMYAMLCKLVHKQMYWIQTNLWRFQPLNIKCNIQMFILHYIMEYVDNLCSPCPLCEQPKS